MDRRTFTALSLAALPLSARSQGYPNKPIRLIIPFSAGGPTDALGRALAKSLGSALGQTVIVENRLGAGGSIGMDVVAKAPPDGYTLGIGHTGSQSINAHLLTKTPYDSLRDFTPITPLVSYTNVLVINPDIPAKTLNEFIEWTKQPGVKATFASGGIGATNHLSGELLKTLTGSPMAHIPYKGNAPALVDVMAGNVSAMFDILITALPQIKAGKVRPLAVTSSKRSAFLPDVPTMREAGVPGYEAAGNDLWFGLFGPAGLPKAILDKLYDETVKAMGSTELQDAIRGMHYDAWTLPPADFKAFLVTDNAKWGKVVKMSGAKAD
jgi:tripartite-type tricarboxylate transporter receptor subunit TctC